MNVKICECREYGMLTYYPATNKIPDFKWGIDYQRVWGFSFLPLLHVHDFDYESLLWNPYLFIMGKNGFFSY